MQGGVDGTANAAYAYVPTYLPTYLPTYGVIKNYKIISNYKLIMNYTSSNLPQYCAKSVQSLRNHIMGVKVRCKIEWEEASHCS